MKFESSDGNTFEVEVEVGMQCLIIKNGIDALLHGENSLVPVSNVDGKTLEKVLEYCKRYAIAKGEGDEREEEKKEGEWDKEYIDVGEGMLYDLLMAANYLEIPGLLHLVARKVADMINKTQYVEDIRELFNIADDFPPEEDKKMREQNPSAFRPKNPSEPLAETPSSEQPQAETPSSEQPQAETPSSEQPQAEIPGNLNS